MKHLPTLRQFLKEAVGAAPQAANRDNFQTSDMKSNRTMHDNPDFVGDAAKGVIARPMSADEPVFVKIDPDGRIVGACSGGERCMPLEQARSMKRDARKKYFGSK